MCFIPYPFFLVILLSFFVQHLFAEGFYKVAVIEFPDNFNFSQTVKDNLLENTKHYLNLIENLNKNQSEQIDLIIFPESTLVSSYDFNETAVQLPKSSDVVLCDLADQSYSDFLKNLSCAAIRYNTTIIINLTEKEICEKSNTECPIFYNTNVALGTNGTIIARYRKWNLFGERGKSKPKTLDLPEIVLKNTTFGMMTCFDIQFGTPAFNLVKEKNVQNVIFPLHWISELPYLTALQVEQMWAQELKVVLLAAGASSPLSGAGGSGIFFGAQGPLEHDILSQKGTKVIVQSVPTNVDQKLNVSYEEVPVDTIDSLASSLDNFYMLIDPSMKDHNSLLLNTSKDIVNATVCHGEGTNILCCEFNISLNVNNDFSKEHFEQYTYHLAAFNGVRTYSKLYYGGVETCGLVACLNNSVSSCGQRFLKYSNITWPLTFNEISIKGNFSQSEHRIQFPTTLLSSIRPLLVQHYSWEKDVVNTKVFRRLTLQKPQERLLTYGIFGRDFERDWDPIRNDTTDKNLAHTVYFSHSFALLISCLLLSIK